MDFHTMVTKFRQKVLQEEQLDELSRHARSLVRDYIDSGTPGRHTPRYSFEHLFGDKMRLIIPLLGAKRREATRLFKRIVDQGWEPVFTRKTIKQKKTYLAAAGGGEYEVEIEVPVLTMAKTEERTIPAGPRKGEVVTSTKKMSLGKLIQRIGTEQDKAWWAENQNDLQTGPQAMKNMQDYFLTPWTRGFKDTKGQTPIIVISRHPMDVARMSDFSTTHSCHSEGGMFFNCAIHESKGHGLVAFQIRARDVEETTRRIENGDDEIFGDDSINFRGPEPAARVRLYKMVRVRELTDSGKLQPVEEGGEEFALPESRVYGYPVPDFLPTVRAWARENQKDIWSKDGGESLDPNALSSDEWVRLGGEYSDADRADGIGGIVADLFDGTPFDDQALEQYESVQYDHDDPYDEDQEVVNEMQQAQEQISRLLDPVHRRLELARRQGNDPYLFSVSGQVDEGWDDIPWYVDGFCGFTLVIDLTEEDYKRIPRARDRNQSLIVLADPPELRDKLKKVEKSIIDILQEHEPIEEYAGWEFSFHIAQPKRARPASALQDIAQPARPPRLIVGARGGFTPERFSRGMDQVHDFENWLEAVEELEQSLGTIKGKVFRKLMSLGIRSPRTFETAAEELMEFKFDNLNVLYDESDPGDGIDIVLKPETLTKFENLESQYQRRVGTHFKVLDRVPAFDTKGYNVSTEFQANLAALMLKIDIGKLAMLQLRRNFKQLIKQAARDADKQLNLPIGPKSDRRSGAKRIHKAAHAGLYLQSSDALRSLEKARATGGVSRELPGVNQGEVAARGIDLWLRNITFDINVAGQRDRSTPKFDLRAPAGDKSWSQQQTSYKKLPFTIGYNFKFKINQEVTANDYRYLKAFLEFLDENLDKFENSIMEQIGELYQFASKVTQQTFKQAKNQGLPTKKPRPTVPAGEAAPEEIVEAKVRNLLRKIAKTSSRKRGGTK